MLSLSGFKKKAVNCDAQKSVDGTKQRIVRNQKGLGRFLESILPPISHYENPDGINKAVTTFHEKMVEDHHQHSRLLTGFSVVLNSSLLTNLKVFTGSAITNSYAESVNVQPHCFVVFAKGTCLIQQKREPKKTETKSSQSITVVEKNKETVFEKKKTKRVF